MWRRRVVAVAATAVIVLSACAVSNRRAPRRPRPLAHSTGSEYTRATTSSHAATHYGPFKVPNTGEPERLADRFQDTMGFVRSDRTPSSAVVTRTSRRAGCVVKGSRPLVGVLGSRDAGETWRAWSLLGEADFHVIAVSGDVIAAYDATGDRLLVSSDGEHWEERDGGIGVSGLAADPDDPERLVAATPAGLELSGGGGSTFEPIADAPRAVVATWSGRTLWAVDAAGGAWRTLARRCRRPLQNHGSRLDNFPDRHTHWS